MTRRRRTRAETLATRAARSNPTRSSPSASPSSLRFFTLPSPSGTKPIPSLSTLTNDS
jgi:hypothetical protein